MSDESLAEMKRKLRQINAQNQALDRKITHSLATQKHRLAGQQKANPTVRFPEPDITEHSRFMHTSDQFALPVQNWKPGNPFGVPEHHRTQKKNIHSADAARRIRVRLEDREVEMLMDQRYETASLELPLHGGVYEIVPTRKEPVSFEHKCIWKEYL